VRMCISLALDAAGGPWPHHHFHSWRRLKYLLGRYWGQQLRGLGVFCEWHLTLGDNDVERQSTGSLWARLCNRLYHAGTRAGVARPACVQGVCVGSAGVVTRLLLHL
jgi:hypothetical protein